MSLRSTFKAVQRRLYDTLLHPLGCFSSLVVFTIASVIVLALLLDPWIARRALIGQEVYSSSIDFADNIGGVNLQSRLAFGPFDIVYTWVNGSDPRWKEKKTKCERLVFRSALEGDHVSITNSTEEDSNSTDASAANRYRDSEELRYSLRSIVKYAPWVRRVYLVTDNQIPYWLNLNHPRLKVVTHAEIFPNKSHLPVFSSPAIEAHLHRIPGLSQKFIYFNDDVMLGAPTWPEDFVSVGGTQRVYLSWDVPKCAPGCTDSWIGDGYCDRACNVSACNFDFPDCVNKSQPETRSSGSRAKSAASTFCAKGCPDSWLGDRVCDTRCKTVECAWDVGDCGMDLVVSGYPGVLITSQNALLRSYDSPPAQGMGGGMSMSMYDDMMESSFYYGFAPSIPLALALPKGAHGAFFNLSQIFPYSGNFTFYKAEHDNPGLIQHAVFLTLHRTLIVLFFDESDEEEQQNEYRHTQYATLSLTARMPEQNYATVQFNVALQKKDQEDRVGLPEGMMNIKAYTSKCDGRTGHDMVQPASVLKTPFRVTKKDGQDKEEGVVFSFPLTRELVSHATSLSQIFVRSEVTLADGKPYVKTTPVCACAMFEDEGGTITRLTDKTEECPVTLASLKELMTSTPTWSRYSSLSYFTVATPSNNFLGTLRDKSAANKQDQQEAVTLLVGVTIPITWGETYTSKKTGNASVSNTTSSPSDAHTHMWTHVKVELLHSSGQTDPLNSKRLACAVAMFRWGGTPSTETSETTSEAMTGSNFTDSDSILQHDNSTIFVHNVTSASHPTGDVAFDAALLAINQGENHTHAYTYIDGNISTHALTITPKPSSTPTGQPDNSTNWTKEKEDAVAHPYPDATLNYTSPNRNRAPNASLNPDPTPDPNPTQWTNQATILEDMTESENVSDEHTTNTNTYGPTQIHASTRAEVETQANANSSTARAPQDHDAIFSEDWYSPSSPNTTDANSTRTHINTDAHTYDAPPLWTELITSFETDNSSSPTYESDKQQRKLWRVTVTARKPQWEPIHIVEEGIEASVLFVHLEEKAKPQSSTVPRALRTSNVEQQQSRRPHMSDVLSLMSRVFSPDTPSHTPVHEWWHRALVAWRAFVDVQQTQDVPSRRLDTYAQSLMYSNRIYNKEFGYEPRKVPAHMPHMIDKDVMQEMQDRWTREWEATSKHRFRSPEDLQYAFSYFFYLMNRNKMQGMDVAKYIRENIDTDSSGYLNENEIRTLASVACGKHPSPAQLKNVTDCVMPQEQREVTRTFTTRGILERVTVLYPLPSTSDVMRCKWVVEALKKNAKRNPTHELGPKEEVAFEMIGDDYNKTVSQLDSIRSRLCKFVCINDDMKNPSPKLIAAFTNFYLSMVPNPSPFELAPGQRNPTLYLDEYKILEKETRAHRNALLTLTLLVLSFATLVYYVSARLLARFTNTLTHADTLADTHTDTHTDSQTQTHPHDV